MIEKITKTNNIYEGKLKIRIINQMKNLNKWKNIIDQKNQIKFWYVINEDKSNQINWKNEAD